tara:strand:+ start:2562 stop:2966 length:405 start_codon:yes stop_codon:yes gene_type:complete
MKKIIILVFTIFCLALLPSNTIANQVWKKGDEVIVFYMCKQEKDIMEVALADSQSREQYLKIIRSKNILKDCISIMPPTLLIVENILGEYKDYNKQNTVILKAVSPNNLFSGYLIISGVPEQKEEYKNAEYLYN